MSENLNRGACDFSQYDTMTNEALEELLRLDSEAPEGQESDTERLLYIMELLARRDRQLGKTGNTAQEAWKAFQQEYLPITDDPEEAPELKSVAKSVRLHRWIAAAAILTLLVAIPVVAAAFGGEKLWNAVANWTKDTFSFVSSQDDNTPALKADQSLRVASVEEGIKILGLNKSLLPTYIPERFKLDYVIVTKTPVYTSFSAFYNCGKDSLNIIVHTIVDDAPSYVEISEEPLEIYEASGREFYILRNLDTVIAAWIEGDHECYISGDLTLEELKQIVDSIPAK